MRLLHYGVLVFVILLTLLSSGCAKGIDGMDVSEVSSLIEGEITFGPLTDIKGENVASYFNFPEKSVNDYCIKIATSEKSADEYGVIEVLSEDQFEAVSKAVLEHLTTRSAVFKQFSELEWKKLNNAVVRRNGRMIIFVVSTEYPQAAAILDNRGAVALQ